MTLLSPTKLPRTKTSRPRAHRIVSQLKRPLGIYSDEPPTKEKVRFVPPAPAWWSVPWYASLELKGHHESAAGPYAIWALLLSTMTV